MKTIYTKDAPEPVGPYSQAVEKNGTYFFSGQIALNTDGELVNDSIEVETKQVLKNIEAVLTEAGLSKSDIVKADIYMTDLNNFVTVNGIYEEFLGDHKPARVTVGVNSLPKGASIEIGVICVKG